MGLSFSWRTWNWVGERTSRELWMIELAFMASPASPQNAAQIFELYSRRGWYLERIDDAHEG